MVADFLRPWAFREGLIDHHRRALGLFRHPEAVAAEVVVEATIITVSAENTLQEEAQEVVVLVECSNHRHRHHLSNAVGRCRSRRPFPWTEATATTAFLQASSTTPKKAPPPRR